MFLPRFPGRRSADQLAEALLLCPLNPQPRAIMYGDVWTAFLKKDAGPSVGGDKKDGAREAGTRSQAPTSSIEAEA